MEKILKTLKVLKREIRMAKAVLSNKTKEIDPIAEKINTLNYEFYPSGWTPLNNEGEKIEPCNVWNGLKISEFYDIRAKQTIEKIERYEHLAKNYSNLNLEEKEELKYFFENFVGVDYITSLLVPLNSIVKEFEKIELVYNFGVDHIKK